MGAKVTLKLSRITIRARDAAGNITVVERTVRASG